MARRFSLVDVFNAGPVSGNPLAVVADAHGMDAVAMQRLTRWLNFSETAFLLPPTDPQADYRLRIFTLDRELPFAGHPTLGSCHAWLAAGGTPRDPACVVQQCEAGLVRVRRERDRYAFAAPPDLRSGPVDEALVQRLAAYLRIERARILDARWVDSGPGWVAVRLAAAAEVLALEPAPGFDGQLDLGVVGPHAPGGEAQFELRAFFSAPDGTIREDPVTGSLNGSVARWLLETGEARTPYVAAQGARVGCRGRVYLSAQSDGTIWVGGRATTVVAGELAD
jgi:PhzF family phenazine biosynthesis protein